MIFGVTTEQYNTIVTRLYLRLSSKTNSIRLTSRNFLFFLSLSFFSIFLPPIPKMIFTHTYTRAIIHKRSWYARMHLFHSHCVDGGRRCHNRFALIHSLSLSFHSNTNNVESSSSTSSSSIHYFATDVRSLAC